jgi:hypothetical protein
MSFIRKLRRRYDFQDSHRCEDCSKVSVPSRSLPGCQQVGRCGKFVDFECSLKRNVQCTTLRDENLKEEFVKETKEEYEDIRKEYLETIKENRFTPLETARSKKFFIDWDKFNEGTQIDLSQKINEIFSQTIFPWPP